MYAPEPTTPLGRERRRRGVSMARLAAASGVGVATVWRAEHGEGQPTIATRLLLAAALGVDVAHLFPDPREAPRDADQRASRQ